MTAPITITSWSCDRDIIFEVCTQPIGEDFALIYVSFNHVGKRAMFCGTGGADHPAHWRGYLDITPGASVTGPATLTLEASEPVAEVACEADGAGEAFILVRRRAMDFHLGERVPRVD